MKRIHVIWKIFVGVWALLTLSMAYAETPLWTFEPLTATKVNVSANSTATIQYQVTNQSSKLHTLVMTTIPGITQVTTAGNCPSTFILAYL